MNAKSSEVLDNENPFHRTVKKKGLIEYDLN